MNFRECMWYFQLQLCSLLIYPDITPVYSSDLLLIKIVFLLLNIAMPGSRKLITNAIEPHFRHPSVRCFEIH